MNASVPIPARVLRLAEQLGWDPETLASSILDHGSRMVDRNIAVGAHPLDIGIDDNEIDISAELDRLTTAERKALTAGEDSQDTPQEEIAERDRIRRGLRSNDDHEL